MFAKQYKNLLLPNVVAFNILKNIDDDDVNLRKNLLLPNAVAFNILKNIDDDDVNLGKALFYGIYNRWGMDTTCSRPILGYKTIKAQHSVRRRPNNASCGRPQLHPK
jgi:hypothetical protein